MLNTKLSFSKTLFLSPLVAAILVSACNDSKASDSSSPAPAAPAAAQDNSMENGLALLSSAADITKRNHVCFTMDVNNVKCVLGDIVAYVPQPILEKEDQAKNNNKKDKNNKETEAEKEAKAQLLANQEALNEARSLVFVAKYCDMEQSVVYSKEGVACTFKPHALYDAGAVAEATQYQMNVIRADEFFNSIAKIPGVEAIKDPAFGTHGGYRLFLQKSSDEKGLAIGENTTARILTKRIDMEGNVLGFYHEELNFINLNPQMKILTKGLKAGDHVKLVFDTALQNEQPLWRTSSLEFGQPYIWEVQVQSVAEMTAEEKSAAESRQQAVEAAQAQAAAQAQQAAQQQEESKQ